MPRQKKDEPTNPAEILILAFIWLFIYASPVIVSNGYDGLNWNIIFESWIRLLPFLLLSVVNHFILVPILFYRHRIGYFSIALVLMILLSLSMTWIDHPGYPPRGQQENRPMMLEAPPDGFDLGNGNLQLPPLEDRLKPRRNSPGSLPPLMNSMIIALLILGFDTGMRAIFRGSKIEQEKQKLEKEKVKSELAFLRNQISPHFFMNTLNNIHSLIDLDTREAKEAVIRLSKLMQHLLYDSERETILLKDEIAFIQSYTELMKLRFTEKVKVSLEIHSDDPGISIPPLLFTSLLENAFKYGVSYKEKSFIDISLSTGTDKLTFDISNSIIAGKNKLQDRENSGIGLENTRKRLDLLYGKGYQMDVTDTGGIFRVTLILPI